MKIEKLKNKNKNNKFTSSNSDNPSSNIGATFDSL